ncbi:MAG: hypothetical protein RLZZ283_187 [Candidatus Parcubacteria bacterium]|jgi:hypothetical protein
MDRIFYNPERVMWTDIVYARERCRAAVSRIRGSRVLGSTLIIGGIAAFLIPEAALLASILIGGGAFLWAYAEWKRQHWSKLISARRVSRAGGYTERAKKNKSRDAVMGLAAILAWTEDRGPLGATDADIRKSIQDDPRTVSFNRSRPVKS